MEGLLGVCLDDATFFEDGAFGGAFDECIAGATEPRVDAEVSILWLVGEVFGFDERRHVGRGGVGVRFRAAAELCVCVCCLLRGGLLEEEHDSISGDGFAASDGANFFAGFGFDVDLGRWDLEE